MPEDKQRVSKIMTMVLPATTYVQQQQAVPMVSSPYQEHQPISFLPSHSQQQQQQQSMQRNSSLEGNNLMSNLNSNFNDSSQSSMQPGVLAAATAVATAFNVQPTHNYNFSMCARPLHSQLSIYQTPTIMPGLHPRDPRRYRSQLLMANKQSYQATPYSYNANNLVKENVAELSGTEMTNGDGRSIAASSFTTNSTCNCSNCLMKDGNSLVDQTDSSNNSLVTYQTNTNSNSLQPVDIAQHELFEISESSRENHKSLEFQSEENSGIELEQIRADATTKYCSNNAVTVFEPTGITDASRVINFITQPSARDLTASIQPSTSTAGRRETSHKELYKTKTPQGKKGPRKLKKDSQTDKKQLFPSPAAYMMFEEGAASLERVFIWNMDETLIIFHSLLSGAYANRFTKNTNELLVYGFRMEELVFHLADTHFFFRQIENCDPIHIDDLCADDTGQDLSKYNFSNDGFQEGLYYSKKLAFRCRKIKDMYNNYRTNVGGLLGPTKRDAWLQIRADIETATDDWSTLATKCLYMSAQCRDTINVLVSWTKMPASLAKVLLFGMGSIFSIENIYNAHHNGALACIEHIVRRFGKNRSYVCIGGGKEQRDAAHANNFPLFKVTSHCDLVGLSSAFDKAYL